jgi:hypothetical protein
VIVGVFEDDIATKFVFYVEYDAVVVFLFFDHENWGDRGKEWLTVGKFEFGTIQKGWVMVQRGVPLSN